MTMLVLDCVVRDGTASPLGRSVGRHLWPGEFSENGPLIGFEAVVDDF